MGGSHRIMGGRLVIEALEARCLLSYNPLDPSFGGNGVVQLPVYSFRFGPQNIPAITQAVTVLPNGNTVVAGTFPVSAGYGNLLRQDAWIEEFDGTGGEIAGQFGLPAASGDRDPTFTELTALANGNILATGVASLSAQPEMRGAIAQVFNPQLFPVGGFWQGTADQAVLGAQADGKIVVSETFSGSRVLPGSMAMARSMRPLMGVSR